MNSNDSLRAAVQARLDSLTKPQGSLGKLEELALRYALLRGETMPALRRKALYLFCGDHGVTAEGVSPFPREVTRQMVKNFLGGGAAVNVLCRHCGVDPVVVDMGVRGEAEAGVVNRKVAEGTRNFAREAAMTRGEARQAVDAGAELAREAALSGADVLACGEMGIGNTTAASALLCAFAGVEPGDAVGRGTGMDDAGVSRKAEVIRRALGLHRPDPRDGLGVLAALGGYEIAGMAGFLIGGWKARRPVVMDGFISCSAALAARALEPACLEAAVFSHRSAERAHARMLEALGAVPLFDLDMRLGEGTGAVLAAHLLEAAVKLYREMATFAEASVSDRAG